MDLFSMGVIDDPDRPRQHKPAPVRCYEAELAPPVIKPQAVCERCCLSPPQVGKTMCIVCVRAVACHARGKRRHMDRRSENRILGKAEANGWFIPTASNRHIVERLVGEGSMRWLSLTERRRYGLAKFDEAAVLVRP